MKASRDKVARSQNAEGGPVNSLAGFDIDDPQLPEWIEEQALTSGGFPYDKRLKTKDYEEQLRGLQIELLKLQHAVQVRGQRVVMVFEGRDAAGKGGAIAAVMEHLNPRHARVVALTKPTDAERGQWYFQRYAAQLPTAGDMVLFDRSWYNRAGVERVMGFCNKDQLADFLREAPQFEGLLVRDDIKLFKFFLSVSRETQLKRFHARRHDPLKQWKITEIDLAAIAKWDAYSEAKEEMFRFTHTDASPWTVIRANDKLRTRLEVIRVVLAACDYEGKNKKLIGAPDPRIVGAGPGFFDVD